MRAPDMKVTVDFPHVLTDRDRHGNVRRYYRRRKRDPKIRLHAQPGTPAFQVEYDAARARSETPPSGGITATADRLRPPKHGALRWLIVAYMGSAEFRRLDHRTQIARRSLLEGACQQPLSPTDPTPFADFPIDRMTQKAVRVLRDRKAADHPGAANNLVKGLRQVFAWAMERELAAANPARDVPFVRYVTTGHHSWTAEEIARFEQRHPIGTKARLALALLIYTGSRRSDVVILGRQHVKDGWLKFTQQKNRNRRPITVEIPILPALQSIIDASPVGDLTYLVGERGGKPFTSGVFGNWFRKRCNEAGLPHCSAHGLRKAGAAIAAENGATAHQLMSIFGWLTMRQAEHYTRAAQRRRMAGDAMGLLIRREPEA